MKKIQRSKNNFKRNELGNILIPLLFIIIAFGILMTSGAMVNKSATDSTQQYGEAQVSSGSGKQNLQLKKITFKAKPTPVSSSCNHDNGKPIVNSGEKYDPDSSDACKCLQYVIECANQKCTKFISIGGNKPTEGTVNQPCGEMQPNFDQWCQSGYLTHAEDGTYCLGKPVIYLYPEKTTHVDVTVKTEGKIVVSDPIYPDGGWKNVLAQSDGTLTYQNKEYRELFYESETHALSRPKAGIIITKQNLQTDLLSFITQLGLTRKDEQQEFLNWWIPKLKRLDSPYIFVSILEKQEKERLDKVVISPTPDTFIDFIVYFSPQLTNYNLYPLILPKTPKRIGFTAVEWGGVIDTK